jgi:hypothetical protein
VELRSWDDLPGVLAGADAVINLAGEDITGGRWTEARKARLEASRVAPTERLVQALGTLADPPGALVNASAVGIYGPLEGPPVDEGQAPGQGFLAALCRRWEAAAEGAAAHGARVVRLRLGLVLARDGGALPRLARSARLGLGVRLGHGRQGLSWIHVDDLVALVLAAAGDPAWAGPVNASAPGPVSQAAFSRALDRRLRRPAPPVPGWLTGAAVRLLLGEMGEAVLLQGAYVLPRRALDLGFRFRFPDLEGALADLLP